MGQCPVYQQGGLREGVRGQERSHPIKSSPTFERDSNEDKPMLPFSSLSVIGYNKQNRSISDREEIVVQQDEHGGCEWCRFLLHLVRPQW